MSGTQQMCNINHRFSGQQGEGLWLDLYPTCNKGEQGEGLWLDLNPTCNKGEQGWCYLKREESKCRCVGGWFQLYGESESVNQLFGSIEVCGRF
jgi:hypothetical protein